MQLKRDNYHTTGADRQYMSVSQYKDFICCESMAMAKMQGAWVPAVNLNYQVGSYIHAWAEGPEALEDFKATHPEMYTQKGQLRSEFRQADQMIATLADDPLVMFALTGHKEIILTGDLAGARWKIRMDVYNPEGKRRIVDLKTTRNITELIWSTERGCKVSFVDAYNYPLQMAVYAEIERQNSQLDNWAETYIVAVSKEDPPDKAVISLVDDARFARELYEVEQNMTRIMAVKEGLMTPRRCEKCAYCRSTKRLKKVLHYSEIGL